MFEKVIIMIAMSQVHWADFEIPALDPPGHSMVGLSSLVNDRGPYGAILESGGWALKLSSSDPGDWRGIIDLSRASAEAIGFDFNSGLEEVEVSWW